MVMQWQDGIPDDAHKRTWGLALSGSLQGAGGVGGLLGSHDVANAKYHWFLHDANGNPMTRDATSSLLDAERPSRVKTCYRQSRAK